MSNKKKKPGLPLWHFFESLDECWTFCSDLNKLVNIGKTIEPSSVINVVYNRLSENHLKEIESSSIRAKVAQIRARKKPNPVGKDVIFMEDAIPPAAVIPEANNNNLPFNAKPWVFVDYSQSFFTSPTSSPSSVGTSSVHYSRSNNSSPSVDTCKRKRDGDHKKRPKRRKVEKDPESSDKSYEEEKTNDHNEERSEDETQTMESSIYSSYSQEKEGTGHEYAAESTQTHDKMPDTPSLSNGSLIDKTASSPVLAHTFYDEPSLDVSNAFESQFEAGCCSPSDPMTPSSLARPSEKKTNNNIEKKSTKNPTALYFDSEQSGEKSQSSDQVHTPDVSSTDDNASLLDDSSTGETTSSPALAPPLYLRGESCPSRPIDGSNASRLQPIAEHFTPDDPEMPTNDILGLEDDLQSRDSNSALETPSNEEMVDYEPPLVFLNGGYTTTDETISSPDPQLGDIDSDVAEPSNEEEAMVVESVNPDALIFKKFSCDENPTDDNVNKESLLFGILPLTTW